MNIEQESKYTCVSGKLRNRVTGEEIPADEPVFILRAKDKHAVEALRAYADLCTDEKHRKTVLNRCRDFDTFASNNPDRMKEPDS